MLQGGKRHVSKHQCTGCWASTKSTDFSWLELIGNHVRFVDFGTLQRPRRGTSHGRARAFLGHSPHRSADHGYFILFCFQDSAFSSVLLVSLFCGIWASLKICVSLKSPWLLSRSMRRVSCVLEEEQRSAQDASKLNIARKASKNLADQCIS